MNLREAPLCFTDFIRIRSFGSLIRRASLIYFAFAIGCVHVRAEQGVDSFRIELARLEKAFRLLNEVGGSLSIDPVGLEQIKSTRDGWIKRSAEKKYFIEQIRAGLKGPFGTLGWVVDELSKKAVTSLQKNIVQSISSELHREFKVGLPDFDRLLAALDPNGEIVVALNSLVSSMARHIRHSSQLEREKFKEGGGGSLFGGADQYFSDLKEREFAPLAHYVRDLRVQIDVAQRLALEYVGGGRHKFLLRVPDKVFDSSCGDVFSKGDPVRNGLWNDRSSFGPTWDPRVHDFVSRALDEGTPRSLDLYRQHHLWKVIVGSGSRGPLKIMCAPSSSRFNVFGKKWDFDSRSYTLQIYYGTKRASCGKYDFFPSCANSLVDPLWQYLEELARLL